MLNMRIKTVKDNEEEKMTYFAKKERVKRTWNNEVNKSVGGRIKMKITVHKYNHSGGLRTNKEMTSIKLEIEM